MTEQEVSRPSNFLTFQRSNIPQIVDRLATARLQKTGLLLPMRTLLSRAIQIDPSFHVALGLIVILGVAEIFFATSYYVGRARANRVSAQAVAATIARPPAEFRQFPRHRRHRSRSAAKRPRRRQWLLHLLHHSLISCCEKAKNYENAAIRQTRWHVCRKRWTANRTIPACSRKWRRPTSRCNCSIARMISGAESSKSARPIARPMLWRIAA